MTDDNRVARLQEWIGRCAYCKREGAELVSLLEAKIAALRKRAAKAEAACDHKDAALRYAAAAIDSFATVAVMSAAIREAREIIRAALAADGEGK